jgi:predicted dinucleotide-binding enzyme
MRIGTLGAGRMATGLGEAWEAAGHCVRYGRRDSLAEAASFGEVVLLAVTYEAVPSVLPVIPPGTVVIDCTNGVDRGRWVRSVYTQITELAPSLQVVKAFNLAHDSTWRLPSRVFDGRPLAVPLCGPPAAVAKVAPLVTDLGCTPFDAGGPERAQLLEATAALAIGLWFAGHDTQAIMTPPPLG